MSVPFYVSPEQIIKDKADYARKGIARGRSVVVLQYDGGILFVAENPSRSLHKISEIYDRIGFAAVGKYNEFENLRVAGVRLADMRGYAYDRRDVNGRSLANAYAQTLGSIFTETTKPYEVELVVAEVGHEADQDEIYRLTFDGSVADEHGYVAMGGQADSGDAEVLELVVLAHRREADPVVDLRDLVQGPRRVLGNEENSADVLEHDDAAAARDPLAGVVCLVLDDLLGRDIERNAHRLAPGRGAVGPSGLVRRAPTTR